MATFKEKCEEYFGTNDFYEVLKIQKDASVKEIKKAYHKLSLLVHPDRVEPGQKDVATEKFKVLGRIHSILQDQDKRKVYDDCGEYDENTDSSFNWMEYWRAMFKKIDIKDIENYEKEYIGSEREKIDIRRAYVASKGNMDYILEMVPFSNCDNEPRIIEIVRKMVDEGEVEEYKGFFNESKVKQMRRHKKWEKERKEAESIDMQQLERELEENMRKRAKGFSDFISSLEDTHSSPKNKRKSITNGSSPRKTRSTRKK